MSTTGTSAFIEPLARNKLTAARAWSRLAASEEQREAFVERLARAASERWHVNWQEAEVMLQRQVMRVSAGGSLAAGASRQAEPSLQFPCIICDGRVIRVEEIPADQRVMEDTAYLAAKIAKYLAWGSCVIRGSEQFEQLFSHYSLHDRDLQQWALETAEALRGRRPDGVDWESVAEEIEVLGKRGKQGPRRQLVRLLRQLLQWSGEPQESKRRDRRQAGIDDMRARIHVALEDGSLPHDTLPALIEEAYERARRKAIRKTRLPDEAFPVACPWSVEQVLDHEFWPAVAGGDRP